MHIFLRNHVTGDVTATLHSPCYRSIQLCRLVLLEEIEVHLKASSCSVQRLQTHWNLTSLRLRECKLTQEQLITELHCYHMDVEAVMWMLLGTCSVCGLATGVYVVTIGTNRSFTNYSKLILVQLVDCTVYTTYITLCQSYGKATTQNSRHSLFINRVQESWLCMSRFTDCYAQEVSQA